MTDWVKEKFKISLLNINTGKVRKTFVNGITNGVFGVHREIRSVIYYSLTHLQSGYKTYNWTSEECAKRIGEYLTEKYKNDFALIEIVDKKVDVKGLDKKILKDEYLKSQHHLFGISEREIYAE